jgi:pimeloyl-ACP methyl ester carboxylesterase
MGTMTLEQKLHIIIGGSSDTSNNSSLAETGSSVLVLLGLLTILLGIFCVSVYLSRKYKLHSKAHLFLGVVLSVSLLYSFAGVASQSVYAENLHPNASKSGTEKSIEAQAEGANNVTNFKLSTKDITVQIPKNETSSTSEEAEISISTSNESGYELSALANSLPNGINVKVLQGKKTINLSAEDKQIKKTTLSNRAGDTTTFKIRVSVSPETKAGKYDSTISYKVDDNYLPFNKYFSQKVDWDKCDESEGYPDDDDVLCAIIEAPLDWSNENTTPIKLAMVKVLAGKPDKKIGSLFTNPGGPGQSGIDAVLGTYTEMQGSEYRNLLDYYDYVGWDPRGVGDSSRVVCDNLTEPTSKDPAEQRAQLETAFEAHSKSCLERSQDGVAAFADVRSSAKDANLMRSLVGDDKLNYTGYSWGSMLGGAIIAMFPDRLNRIVLDGIQSPNISTAEVNTFTAKGATESFSMFLKDCPTTTSPKDDKQYTCPFSANEDEAMNELGAFLNKADATPIPALNESGVEFDGHKIYGTIYNDLFQGTTVYGEVMNAFAMAIQDNDASGFNTIYKKVVETGDFDTEPNMSSVFKVTMCEGARNTYEEEMEQTKIILKEQPILGKYFVDYNAIDVNNLELHSYSCVGLPDRSEPKLDLSNPEIPPVLLSAATGDPATAYLSGVAYAKELANSVFITFNGPGHCPFANKASRCTMNAALGFLLDGVMPKNGLVCQPDNLSNDKLGG